MNFLLLLLLGGCIVGLVCFVWFARSGSPGSQEENEPEENATSSPPAKGNDDGDGSSSDAN